MTAGAVPRRFALHRHRDRSGVSGVGVVAFGTWYPSGEATLAWCSGPIRSVTVFSSIADIERIHGHGGDSEVVWLDPPRQGRNLAPFDPGCDHGDRSQD